jgi:hypothetical protein
MERESQRAGLNGAPLIGLLSRLALLDGPSTKPSFVQGLGQWLGWADAIPLAAALAAAPSPTAHAATRPAQSAARVEAEFERVRASLLQRIDDDGAGKRRIVAAPHDDAEPQRQRYVSLQQAMQSAIEPLRALARAAVARRSADLQRLAALDAMLEPVLAAREQASLGLLPTLLATHHERLRRAAPDGATRWIEVFRQDMHSLLRAELELRLQPVRGLIDALHSPPQDDDE